MDDLYHFLTPVDLFEINEDEGYLEGQIGRAVKTQVDEDFDLNEADLIILGVKEWRGNGDGVQENNAADLIRRELYRLHYWHGDLKIADAGNTELGAELDDSYAALQTILGELYRMGKTVLIIGGSHDMALAQYRAFSTIDVFPEVTGIDSSIDLHRESRKPAEQFLLDMFTGDPNYLKHYNHLGFQSYFVHPQMLQTIDKLRFDCYRLGTVQEKLDDFEPVFRNSDMLMFDISAIKNADAPANTKAPNGFTGTESCTLTRFAGMSDRLKSIGIYGYDPAHDRDNLTAKQISQMIWYFMDGRHRMHMEATVSERHNFNEYHTVFAEVDTTFLQSKRTKRWWMQMPDGQFTACSENDYLTAGRNELPERWLRIQERSM